LLTLPADYVSHSMKTRSQTISLTASTEQYRPICNRCLGRIA